MDKAAVQRTVSDEAELEGTRTEQNELDPADDDLRTTETTQIRHPNKINSPNIIEDDQPTQRPTRPSKREKFLTAADVSGSCLTARQAASRRFSLEFLTNFAGSVLDGDTGELPKCRHLINSFYANRSVEKQEINLAGTIKKNVER